MGHSRFGMTIDNAAEKAINNNNFPEELPSQWMQYKECLLKSQESSASNESENLMRN